MSAASTTTTDLTNTATTTTSSSSTFTTTTPSGFTCNTELVSDWWLWANIYNPDHGTFCGWWWPGPSPSYNDTPDFSSCCYHHHKVQHADQCTLYCDVSDSDFDQPGPVFPDCIQGVLTDNGINETYSSDGKIQALCLRIGGGWKASAQSLYRSQSFLEKMVVGLCVWLLFFTV